MFVFKRSERPQLSGSEPPRLSSGSEPPRLSGSEPPRLSAGPRQTLEAGVILLESRPHSEAFFSAVFAVLRSSGILPCCTSRTLGVACVTGPNFLVLYVAKWKLSVWFMALLCRRLYMKKERKRKGWEPNNNTERKTQW